MIASKECEHEWILNHQVRIGNSDPLFVYICDHCAQKETSLGRRRSKHDRDSNWYSVPTVQRETLE